MRCELMEGKKEEKPNRSNFMFFFSLSKCRELIHTFVDFMIVLGKRAVDF